MTSYSWSSVTSASSKLRKLSTACLPRWDSRGWPFPGIVSLLRDLRLGDVPPDVEFGVAAAPWPA